MNQQAQVPKLDVELSADSKKNAYTVSCREVGHERHYAVCLSFIERQKNHKLYGAYPECSRAIRNKDCPALKMRKKELDAGHAMFFMERMTLQELVQKEEDQAIKLSQKPTRKMKRVAATPAADLQNQAPSGYAEAINRAIAANQDAPAAEVKPVVHFKPGETMLEAARRMLAEGSK